MSRSRVAHLLHWGEEEKAIHLHNALNAIDRAFGFPEQPMPAPASPSFEGLLTVPADHCDPSEMLDAMLDRRECPECGETVEGDACDVGCEPRRAAA